MLKLVIAIDSEILRFSSHLNPDMDVLAITAGAMACLDHLGIKYKKLEDFYSPADHVKDQLVLDKSLKILLDDLDRLYSRNGAHPRPYSGNAFWFLHRLSHLLYLANVSRELKTNYQTIYLTQPLSEFELQYSRVTIDSL